MPAEVPTEVPTLVPAEILAIPPVAIDDTFSTGTGWNVLDGNPATTWYMEVPAPVVAEVAPIEPIEPPGLPSEGTTEVVAVEEVPVDVPVVQATQTEDLQLEIDLGYVQTVGSVRWQWTETIYGHGAEIQISLDGETWTTVAWPDTWNAPLGEWQEVGVGLDARFVRFLFPNAELLPVVGGLNEVEILPLTVP